MSLKSDSTVFHKGFSWEVGDIYFLKPDNHGTGIYKTYVNVSTQVLHHDTLLPLSTYHLTLPKSLPIYFDDFSFLFFYCFSIYFQFFYIVFSSKFISAAFLPVHLYISSRAVPCRPCNCFYPIYRVLICKDVTCVNCATFLTFLHPFY